MIRITAYLAFLWAFALLSACGPGPEEQALVAEKHSLMAQRDALQAAQLALQSSLDQTQQRVAELEQSLAERATQGEQLATALTQSQRERETLAVRFAELQDEHRVQGDRLTVLTEQLSDQGQLNNVLENDNRQLGLELRAHRESRDRLQGQLDDLNLQLSSCQTDRAELAATSREALGERESLRTLHPQLLADLDGLRDARDECRQVWQEAEALSHRLANELANREERLQTLSAHLLTEQQARQRELQSYREVLQEHEQSLISAQADFQAQQQAWVAQTEIFQQISRTERERHAAEVRQLKDTLTQVDDEHQRQLDALNAALKQQRNLVDDQRLEAAYLLDEAGQRVGTLEAENQGLRDALETERRDRAEVMDQWLLLQLELNGLDDWVEQMNRQMEQARERLQD